jgi:hypothetical protein
MVKEVVTIAFKGKTVDAISYDDTTKLSFPLSLGCDCLRLINLV